MEIKGLSYFGAALVTRYLLAKSKAGKTGSESYIAKMNRDGFHTRVQHVCNCINSSAGDPNLSAKAIHKAFFTDMAVEDLSASISEVMACLANGETDVLAMMYEPGEFGSFQFAQKETGNAVNDVPAIAESLGLGKDDLEDGSCFDEQDQDWIPEPVKPFDAEGSEEEEKPEPVDAEIKPFTHWDDLEYNPYPAPDFDMEAEPVFDKADTDVFLKLINNKYNYEKENYTSFSNMNLYSNKNSHESKHG